VGLVDGSCHAIGIPLIPNFPRCLGDQKQLLVRRDRARSAAGSDHPKHRCSPRPGDPPRAQPGSDAESSVL